VIRKDGLYCWGTNGRGELGTNTTTDSTDAVRAEVAGSDIVEVATHSGRTCVRRSTGEIACWGANDHGQIGDGTRDNSLVPVSAMGITDAKQMAVDDNSTCVVHGAQRQVSCWGESSTISPDKGNLLPALIPGLSAIKQLSVGTFGSYCALDATASVLCWRMTDGAWSTPKKVALDGARVITMPHADYPCAIPASGNIVCQSSVDNTRVELPDSASSVDIEAGSAGLMLCAGDAKDAWQCWNVPSYIQASMGIPDVAGVFPFTVAADAPVKELATAGYRTCVLRTDNAVTCVDDATQGDSVDALLKEMRLNVKRIVSGLPD
jgi:hypothetical protein